MPIAVIAKLFRGMAEATSCLSLAQSWELTVAPKVASRRLRSTLAMTAVGRWPRRLPLPMRFALCSTHATQPGGDRRAAAADGRPDHAGHLRLSRPAQRDAGGLRDDG